MKKQKIVSLISNILLGIGAGLSVLAIILTITVTVSLPPGVCPIDNNRPLYYIAAAMLIGSLALSTGRDVLKKRNK